MQVYLPVSFGGHGKRIRENSKGVWFRTSGQSTTRKIDRRIHPIATNSDPQLPAHATWMITPNEPKDFKPLRHLAQLYRNGHATVSRMISGTGEAAKPGLIITTTLEHFDSVAKAINELANRSTLSIETNFSGL